MRRPLWIPWRWWRRGAQCVLLLAFLWLFRRTEYTGADELAGGENLLFRLDPVLGASAMIAARQFVAAYWPAAVVVALTLIFGRFFCGWVCPLGTLLDLFHRFTRPLARRTNRLAETYVLPPMEPGLRRARYLVLILVLVAAVFAMPLVGYVNPFSLLVRGMTFWFDPALYRGVDALFGWMSGRWSADVVEPFVRKHFLPFRAMVFHLAGLSAAILGVIFALEWVSRRFWCRYLCPTGAAFGLLSRRSLLKRVPSRVCGTCDACQVACRMDAITAASGFSPEACTLCMDCVAVCPKGISQFHFAARAGKRSPRPVSLSRRSALAGIAAGAVLPGAAFAARLVGKPTMDPHLLRPPGAGEERTFLNLCIRCGECLKVCPTNVLQPAVFEAGVEGVFSPRLVPRFIFEQTYCEYSCTLCGQVCPTGAIPRLTEEEKHACPMGKAYFDHARCLPWGEQTPCIRCEEMCPTPEKAIKILHTFTIKDKNGQEVEIHQPYVDRDLCVGCGICESNCTIEGESAIRVFRLDAADPGTETRLPPK